MDRILEESSEPSLRPKRRMTDSELDITPMIDIVFLLLSFFVVVSKMDPKLFTDLPLSKNGKPVVTQYTVVLIVKRSEAEEPDVFAGEKVEGRFTTKGEELYNDIVKYVKDQTEGNPKLTSVVIKAEKGVKNKYVDPVFRAAKEGAPEGFEIRTGVEEKQ